MEGDNKRRRPQIIGRRAFDHHGRARRSGSAAQPRESDEISDEYGGGGGWEEQSHGAPDGAEYYDESELPVDFLAHAAFEGEQAAAPPSGLLAAREGGASLIADGPDAGEAEPASLHTGPESEHMAAGGAAAEAASTRPPILLADRHSRRRRRTGNRDEPSILELLGHAGDELDDLLEGLLPSGDELAELEQRANDPDSALRGDADDGDDGPVVLAAAPSAPGLGPLPEAGGASAAAQAALQVAGGPLAVALPPGPGGAAAPLGPRQDKADKFVLFGDIQPSVQSSVVDNFFAFLLRAWAFKFGVSRVAVTALLALLWGVLGNFLGISRSFFRRRGPIPTTAKTLYRHSARVTDAVGFTLLKKVKIGLGTDEAIRGRWRGRFVEAWVSPDLRQALAIPVLNPDLNSPATPAYYDPEERMPPGFVCASMWLCDEERAARNERLARVNLVEEVKQHPGMDPANVGVMAIGVNPFYDSGQAFDAQSAAVTAALYRITNLHPSVCHQPKGIVIGGHWIPPGIVSAAKVAQEDVSMNASPATKDRKELVMNDIWMQITAKPLMAALAGPALFVRAKKLRGLPPDYPYQVRTGPGRHPAASPTPGFPRPPCSTSPLSSTLQRSMQTAP